MRSLFLSDVFMDEPLSDREVPNILRVRDALRTSTNVCVGGYVYIGIEMKTRKQRQRRANIKTGLINRRAEN